MAILLPALLFGLFAAEEAVSYVTAASALESAVRVSENSMLGCFHSELRERYGILALSASEEELEERLRSYVEPSVYGKGQKGFHVQIRAVNVSASPYALSNPELFRAAVLKALPHLLAQELRSSFQTDSACVPDEEKETEHANRTLRNGGVLETLPSRQLQTKGVQLPQNWEGGAESGSLLQIVEESAVNAYIAAAFRNHVTPNEDRFSNENCFFRNEWEYLLAGETSDEANQREVKGYLLALRTALNLAYLATDVEKQETVTAVAGTLTGPAAVWTVPALLSAWAGLEAAVDLHQLQDGKTVPLWKTPQDWNTSVQALLQFLNGTESEETGTKVAENGWNYQKYLLLLLHFLPEDTCALRMMDLMQINLQAAEDGSFSFAHAYIGYDARFCWEQQNRQWMPAALRQHETMSTARYDDEK